MTVTSPDRNVMIPVRLDGVDAKPRYAVLADGRWEHDFRNLSGSIDVTNLADGRIIRVR